jgi:hypothetical protein
MELLLSYLQHGSSANIFSESSINPEGAVVPEPLKYFNREMNTQY